MHTKEEMRNTAYNIAGTTGGIIGLTWEVINGIWTATSPSGLVWEYLADQDRTDGATFRCTCKCRVCGRQRKLLITDHASFLRFSDKKTQPCKSCPGRREDIARHIDNVAAGYAPKIAVRRSNRCRDCGGPVRIGIPGLDGEPDLGLCYDCV